MSSVIGGLSRKVGFDNQTLPESTDDHRATQLHHVPGRHPGDIQYLEAERAALQETEAQILAVVEARRKAAETTVASPASTFTPAPYTPPPATGGAKRDASAAAAEREAEAVRRLIAELERELSLVGATDLERETANALRQAGASATEEQRAKIIALVAALAAEEAAMEGLNSAAEEFNAIGKDLLGGFIQDLKDGKSATEALSNALGKVADKLLDIGLNALFSGGGAIGPVFTLNFRSAA